MSFEWFVALRYLREGKVQTALILGAVSIGVAVVVFLSVLIGVVRGLVFELISLLGWAVAFFGAFWLAPLLAVFNERSLHRLQAGPYASRAEAQTAAQRLRDSLQLVPAIVERR